LWFDSEEALALAATTQEGQEAGAKLLEDEQRFLDLARCEVFLSDDQTIVG
jgi:hypothetical protein